MLPTLPFYPLPVIITLYHSRNKIKKEIWKSSLTDKCELQAAEIGMTLQTIKKTDHFVSSDLFFRIKQG